MKRCKQCRLEKPRAEFPGRRGVICHDCRPLRRLEQQRAWRANSPMAPAERARQRQRETILRRDPERRDRLNAKIRARWQDPEYAARRRADRKLYYQRVMADPQRKMLWNLRKQAQRYGLKAHQITEQIARQGGRCGNPGCRARFTAEIRTRLPCIDHDHTTGVIRGILCSGCNVALGLAGDNRQRLSGLIRYLAAGAWTEPLDFSAAQ